MTGDAPGSPAERRRCGARHGVAVPRGMQSTAGAAGGRFGRMFPYLPPCRPSGDAITALSEAMIGRTEQNDRIPAGFTYLGQFIDHDLTFDPMSHLDRVNDPHALTNFRTPRFDLDSLYGSGPDDEPYLYDWDDKPHPGVKLLVGRSPATGGPAAVDDLPRNSQERALIGDPRNDEHLIIAQLHLLFIHFHNKVVERVAKPGMMESREVLVESQRIVRWHYQWIVVHDYLRRIVGDVLHKDVLRPGDGDGAPTVQRRFFTFHRGAAIPVEFSAAAFRLGHSMVRLDYKLKPGGAAVTLFGRNGEDDLGGCRALPPELKITWSQFFFPVPAFDGVSTPTGVMRSLRLDTLLVDPLSRLPPDDAQLARLNLLRGRALGLPSGPAVARWMSEAPLTEEQLVTKLAVSPYQPANVKPLLEHLDDLPLWPYILLEAKILGGDGVSLGPVGGRIVAEVLVGLLEADPFSWLRQQPAWKPELPGATGGDFTMMDLVRYVEDPALL